MITNLIPMLYLIRKATPGRPPMLNNARRAALQDALSKARVRRPGLEEMILANAIGRMASVDPAALSAALVANEPARSQWIAEHGLPIPADSLGRKGRADQSTAESIRLWIKQRMAIDGVPVIDPNAIAIVVANVPADD